jgi:FMN-dependent NADH-azoreductase
MYNFNIPSQLKSWFDHLARAGVTFHYTEQGPVGLIEDKPVYLVATRGGLYAEQGQDFQVDFVKQFLGFIGLKDIRLVLAEGLAMDTHRDQSLEQARAAFV